MPEDRLEPETGAKDGTLKSGVRSVRLAWAEDVVGEEVSSLVSEGSPSVAVW